MPIVGDVTLSKRRWHYALIKAGPDDDDNIFVELYVDLSKGLSKASWCNASPCTLQELERAVRDVALHGVITWFWENGTFTYVPATDAVPAWYDWKENLRDQAD